jgi:integrase
LECYPSSSITQARNLVVSPTLQDVSRLTQAWGDPVRPIFLVGVLTGLRIGELLALYVEDVDLSDAMLHVRRDVYRGRVGTTKAPRSERHVLLASALIHAVRKWLEIRPKGSDWLFPSKAGTPYRDRNLPRRNVWPVCDGLGVRRFGWHSLRHTFSTYNGNNRVPVPVLQALLGHSSAQTTMIYTHPLEDAKRQAVEHLAGILFPNVPTSDGLGSGGGKLIQ